MRLPAFPNPVATHRLDGGDVRLRVLGAVVQRADGAGDLQPGEAVGEARLTRLFAAGVAGRSLAAPPVGTALEVHSREYTAMSWRRARSVLFWW